MFNLEQLAYQLLGASVFADLSMLSKRVVLFMHIGITMVACRATQFATLGNQAMHVLM